MTPTNDSVLSDREKQVVDLAFAQHRGTITDFCYGLHLLGRRPDYVRAARQYLESKSKAA